MTKAFIYKPSRSAMQSGKQKTKNWVMIFTEQKPQYADSLMGWIGSGATESQIKLKFGSKEEAVNYAQQKGLTFEVKDPQFSSFKRKSYSDNFS